MTDDKSLVSLVIEDQIFKVDKGMLIEHSDYFRAMFSGNYVENDQPEIVIDVIDANSMKIIIKYMSIGLIDLTEYSLSTIGELAAAANFLQITELIKQIEYTLNLQFKPENWIETLKIAESCSYKSLEELTAIGLLSFNMMKPEHIPNMLKLYWYLSNNYLKADNEVEVFKFGLNWVAQHDLDADALLVILNCLDISRLTLQNFNEIINLMYNYLNSLALSIVNCLHNICKKGHKLCVEDMLDNQQLIMESFSERVFHEVMHIVKTSKRRLLQLTPSIPMWVVKDTKPEVVPHFMYTYDEKNGFTKWLEVAEKNLWGWSVVSWGPTKLVVVCGEHGRGTGVFMKDVKVYDTLRKEWIQHGVELPPRRHAGLTILEDSVFIIGGVGGFRVLLDTALVYNLKQRSYRKIAKLTDAIQNPAVCTHKDKVYAAGHKNIYLYEELGESDRWLTIVETDIRSNCLISFKEYIYCTQNYFGQLYRFSPEMDKNLEMITYFTNPPAAICNLGDTLIVFTRTMCGQADNLAVEEYCGDPNEKPKVLFSQSDSELKVNDVAGACSLVLKAPPIINDNGIPEYHMQCLRRYINTV